MKATISQNHPHTDYFSPPPPPPHHPLKEDEEQMLHTKLETILCLSLFLPISLAVFSSFPLSPILS